MDRAITNYTNNGTANTLTTSDLFTNPSVYRTCEILARSNFVPDSYKGKPEDIMAALQISTTHHMDPFTVMQNLQMVKGNARWKSDYTIGAINASGLFVGNLKFDITRNDAGEAVACKAWAVEKASGEKIEGTPITWEMVAAEGWNKDSTTKAGYVQKSKWNTMREQMFKYRAAVFFARAACPEVLMGYYTADEGEDIIANQEMQYEDKTQPSPAPEPEPEKITAEPRAKLTPKRRLYDYAVDRMGADGAAEACRTAMAEMGVNAVTEDNLGDLCDKVEAIYEAGHVEAAPHDEPVPEYLSEDPLE